MIKEKALNAQIACAATKDSLQSAFDFVEQWVGKEEETLVYPCFGPHAPYSVSARQFQDIVEGAKKHKVLIHTHISETQDENTQIREKYGMSPTRWLESLGVFSQQVLAAHSIHLDDVDLDIYAKNKVAVTYNPVSNMKLVSGIMPLEKMLARDITVSIGTDGAQSNNSMDLLQDVKMGVLLQKLTEQDAAFFDAEKSVRMMTIEGAKALGMDTEIGSLEIGKKADFITLNHESINFIPLHRDRLKNLYATIAYSAIGNDVLDSVVNGRWIMKDKKLQTVDEKQIYIAGQEASDYLLKER